jgi:hypothetical protein
MTCQLTRKLYPDLPDGHMVWFDEVGHYKLSLMLRKPNIFCVVSYVLASIIANTNFVFLQNITYVLHPK